MRFRFRLRRIVLGLAVGLLAGLPLTVTLGHPALAIVLGAFCGAVYSLANPSAKEPGDYLDGVFTAAVLGIPLWGRSAFSPCRP